ncbi:MAG: Ig-like domain-containing protein [Bacteroidales bacterium]|nr:Ig-like domain-containing protein [Bacteroidales bacterium]
MRNISGYIFLFFIGIFFVRCAKIGSPTGGPKDETPPRVIKSIPQNYSVHYSAKNIVIYFDEYIQLKNINQELIVSPPLQERPITRLNGKKLIIDLNNTLRDSTTYTLNFGNALADNNEGNLLPNFEFVFSTGSFLDSMTVSGTLLNAFDLKVPEKPVIVMLYDNLNDSAPLQEIPAYIGQTNIENGSFAINNVKADSFRIFALQDANRNLLFDVWNEPVAFIDSVFYLHPDNRNVEDLWIADSLALWQSRLTDSLVVDSIQDVFIESARYDSVFADSTLNLLSDSAGERRLRYGLHMNLYLFEEINNTVYIGSYDREERNKLNIVFNRTPHDSVQIVPINYSPKEEDIIKEYSADLDSVIYWIADTVMSNLDSIYLQVSYLTPDSMDNLYTRSDTLQFRYTEKKDESSSLKRRKKDEVEEVKENFLELNMNVKPRSTLDLNNSVRFFPTTPVLNINPSLISFSKIVDTLEYSMSFQILKDSLKLRKIYMDASWEEDMKYKINILPGAFTDIFGLSNDTIIVDFTTAKLSAYGRLIMNTQNVQGPAIIQLISEKGDKVFNQKYISTNEPVIFDYLKPGKYGIKVIYDDNANRQWDTGKYIEKLQPEKVLFYKGEIEIRANWDMEITMQFE